MHTSIDSSTQAAATPHTQAQVRAPEYERPAPSAWRQGPLRDMSAQQLAHGLGWFSIALGVVEVLAPRGVAMLAGGSGRHTALVRLFGLREIATGLAIFAGGRKPAGAMWARVGGDALDLAALAALMALPGSGKARAAIAAANVAAITALDTLCARELSREAGWMTQEGALCVRRSVVINRAPGEIYAFWKNVENFPRFMLHLESVRQLDERRSHWVTQGPAGRRVEWDAETTEDEPDRRLAWRTLEAADVEHAGWVEFEPRPGGRGCIVRVELRYKAPGGVAGAAFARLFNQSPEQQLYDDLRRLKQVIEVGEVLRSDGSPDGAGQVRQRPAQPLPHPGAA